ncbi:AAA-like domain-containing protein [Desulfococcaceae bacterium HSG8]|nr:AAA-like domain-containing protein [Desulfococcaceae bacterium HSG8]
MRRFHSYGPVDSTEHFRVPRKELIRRCTEQMIGNPGKGGHYFTIWAPRQTGKTWLMRQVKKEIGTLYPDRFAVRMMSVQGVVLEKDDPPEYFLSRIPLLFSRFFNINVKKPGTWEELGSLFLKNLKLFEKPLILFIDEFDKLPPTVIDRLVGMFRDIYLDRENSCLHSLALIGVRAVLGVESERGSPFNIQRSLHLPNFTIEEVRGLYRQYQEETGQKVEPEVVTEVFKSTRGQPGLVCWFGELLTEKYNPGKGNPIRLKDWKRVCHRALNMEWNNTVLNLVKKARGKYQNYVLELFARSDIRFALDAEWCGYLYLNGIIDAKTVTDETGEEVSVCFFSSPFIQQRLYNAMTADIVGDRLPILALEPLDDLSDVFDSPGLDIPALLERYKTYLKRLKAKGLNPWKDQPGRTDMHLTEYVGHFHLYFWLQNAIGRRCVISPEFPTGNGRVDLHLKCGEKRGIIEVKSFRDLSELKASRGQAARYAKKLGLNSVTLAVFVPVEDENILEKLSGQTVTEGVKVTVSAIGWV